MSTVQAAPCSQSQKHTITIKVQDHNICVEPPAIIARPGDTVRWQMEHGQTNPFTIVFANPVSPAPVMMLGTTSNKNISSRTEEYPVVDNPLRNRYAMYFYNVFYMDIENINEDKSSPNYRLMHNDPVIIVEPSGGNT